MYLLCYPYILVFTFNLRLKVLPHMKSKSFVFPSDEEPSCNEQFARCCETELWSTQLSVSFQLKRPKCFVPVKKKMIQFLPRLTFQPVLEILPKFQPECSGFVLPVLFWPNIIFYIINNFTISIISLNLTIRLR